MKPHQNPHPFQINPVMMNNFWSLNMKDLKKENTDKPFGERLFLPQAGKTYQRASDIVEHLFGKMTHLSFVVELGAKGWRERNRS